MTTGAAGSLTGRRAALVAALAFAATVVAAVVRALAGDWYPVGDNAYFALRSRDVLTEHHPLLGTWTSASQSVGFDVNNPGPLLFDALAIPAKIDITSLPVGVGAIVLVTVAIAALCAHRAAGERGVLAVLFASAALAWAMGPELLVDPWQPHALLFPFLALIAAAWSGVARSDGALLAAVGLGSFIVQTHLSYAPLVAALGALTAGAVVVRAIRRPERRRRSLIVLAGAAVLALVLWSQPIVEQVTADDRGNLSRLVDLATQDRTEDQVGAALGVRVAGTLVAPLPLWVPPSFEDAYATVPTAPADPPVFERVVSTPVAVASLAATLLALAAVAAAARRRQLVAAAGVVAVVVVVSTLTVVSLPLGVYGLPAHHIRWLWPTAIAVTTVLVSVALARRAGVVAVAAATVVMAALALVPTRPAIGPTADADAGPPLRALAPQLDRLRGQGPLELDLLGLRLFEPYSISVVLELAQRGVEVTVSDPGMIRQLGPERAATGDEAGRMFVLQGELAVSGFEGATRVAFVPGLDEEEHRTMERLAAAVDRLVEEGEVVLTPAGEEAVASGRLVDIERVLDDDRGAVGGGAGTVLRAAVEDGFVHGGRSDDLLRRWAALHRRFDRQTVGVWVDWAGDEA